MKSFLAPNDFATYRYGDAAIAPIWVYCFLGVILINDNKCMHFISMSWIVLCSYCFFIYINILFASRYLSCVQFQNNNDRSCYMYTGMGISGLIEFQDIAVNLFLSRRSCFLLIVQSTDIIIIISLIRTKPTNAA